MPSFAPYQYKEILLFLGTAGIVAPLFRRLRLSPILGYLAAGILLGPYGLGLIAKKYSWASWVSSFALDNIADVAVLGEFGVVFLLFMIGLELSWERLARLRRLVFGFGLLQILGCAAVLGLGAWAFGETPASASVLGFGLALSSTAIVIPVLADHKRLGSAAGRTIFSTLLFQDLMVAPLLLMIAMLATHGSRPHDIVVYMILPAIVGMGTVVIGGRLVMRPFFHLVAAAGSTEFFIAACLLVVIGTGVLSAMSGFSMGLGAFTAGLLLAETEYRREIEVTIEPFKGLLLGLFFVSVGAGLDLSAVASAPIRILGVAAFLIIAKLVVIYLAGRIFRLPRKVSTEAALMLAPGGEFAFVMLTAAIASKVVPAGIAADAMVSVTLSMFAIPWLGELAARLPRGTSPVDAELAEISAPPAGAGAHKAIIVGYGRVGQLVGEMLESHDIPFLAVDQDVARVKKLRQAGIEIYWGNASRPDFLARCGLATARALIITVDAPRQSEDIVTAAKSLRSDLTIVARARDAQHATLLYRLGVTDAVPETIEASLQLSEAALVDLGIPIGRVIAAIHEKRDEFRKILQPVARRAERRRELKLALQRKDANKPNRSG
ncbi:MAG: cation:proton antiporter [Beijerinckiaceae bacterium]